MPVYLNNAATSYPVPDAVRGAVVAAMREPPVEPGRTHTAAEDPLGACRNRLAQLTGLETPTRVALFPSATHAINCVIHGVMRDGGHAVTTDAEHNSVLRPLSHAAAEWGVQVTHLSGDGRGKVDPETLRHRVRSDTKLIALTHASNVTGVVQPVEEVARVAAEHEIPLLVDAAQSAGVLPVEPHRWPGRVFVALAGHKGLYGPAGTGALLLPDDRLKQQVVGGTGIRSESSLHPPTMPLRHEAGTPNLVGLAGLTAGVAWVLEQGVEVLAGHRAQLAELLRQGLDDLGGRVSLVPSTDSLATPDRCCGVVSFTARDLEPRELGFALQESFGMVVRTGLHCAPRIHPALGTSPGGTVRVSVGAFNTRQDVEQLLNALQELLG
jgi:cysteine desulfurase family protein